MTRGLGGGQVSVFNPTPRTTYLNITRENIVTVFGAELAHDGAAVVAAPLSAPSGAASAVPAPPLPSASAAPGPATAAPGPATASPETPRAKHQPPAPAPAPPAAPVPALSQLAVSPDHRAVLEAAAAAIPGAAAADVTTIAAFLEGLDDIFFGDDLDALGGA